MSDYHLIKPFYACFIYFLESVPPIYPSGVTFGPHSCQVSAPVADSGPTKRIFRGDRCHGDKRRRETKTTPTRRLFFSKWSFIFLAHIFLHSATPPTCKVTSSSTPLYIQLPQNIHFSSSSSSLRFFFFINTTNTDRWANSANLEILWNCYVMRLLCFRILILRLFIAVLPLNSTSLLSSPHSPMFDVEFCFDQAETRPKREKRWQQRRFYGCMWRRQSSLQTLLSHFLLSKEGSIKFLTIDQSD